MQCVHCNKTIVDDAKFCSYCGVELAVCKKCGKRNPDEAAYCMYCGFRLRGGGMEQEHVLNKQTPTDGKALEGSNSNDTTIVNKLPEETPIVRIEENLPSHVGKTCPYCQVPIKPNEAIVVCSDCKMIHHEVCWQENAGKCTTFGCKGIDDRQRKENINVAKNVVIGRATLTEDEVLGFLLNGHRFRSEGNLIEAFMWFSLAAKGGADEATKIIPELLKRMNYDQTIQANRLYQDYVLKKL